MTVQGNNILRGSLVSTGVATTLALPGSVDKFFITNRSIWGTGPADLVVKSEWSLGMGVGTSINTIESAANVLSAGVSTVNGFTEIDFRNPPSFTPVVVTSITQANPAVVTANNHGLIAGDIVAFNSVVGMEQLSSIVFEVTNVLGVNSFNIGMDTSGFSAAGAGGTVVKLFDSQFYRPQRRFITAITQANPCVITHSIHLGGELAVGEKYRVQVPSVYGMQEIDGLEAEITAVNAATNQITVNIDSSAFSAFTYPVNPSSLPFTPAQMLPIGDDTTTLAGAVRSRAILGLNLGTDVVGANTNIMDWIAFKGETII
jgi:hypothetical protein